jgi:pSer/pThr/pTyr-binding forkhead associated (FHA) protein
MAADDGLDKQTVLHDRGTTPGVAGGAFQAVVVSASILQVIPLPASGSLTIGRYHASAIAIDDETISRFHAVLHIGPPFEIEDVGSANGTSVDASVVTAGTKKLVDLGAVIRLGAVVLVIQRRQRR